MSDIHVVKCIILLFLAAQLYAHTDGQRFIPGCFDGVERRLFTSIITFALTVLACVILGVFAFLIFA